MNITRALYVFIAIYIVAILSFAFMHNLPHWCANPQGNGNWMVVPLCTK